MDYFTQIAPQLSKGCVDVIQSFSFTFFGIKFNFFEILIWAIAISIIVWLLKKLSND